MNSLIEEYRATLKMVEEAKRQSCEHITITVVLQGRYQEKNYTLGKSVKCPRCGKAVPQMHIYRLDNRTVTICTKCRDAILEYAADMMLDKPAAEQDCTNLASASDSLRYAIQYMETGFMPGYRRGAHRLSAEQRETPVDPFQFQISTHLIKMVAVGRRQPEELSQEKTEILNDFLAMLTEKQKEAFVLVRGRRYTYEQAGRILKLSTGAIKKHVYGAERKLFLAAGNPKKGNHLPPNSERVFSGQSSFKKPQNEGLIQRTMFSEVM